MIQFKWDELKNEWLKVNRGISFEEIIESKFLDITDGVRENQQIILFEYERYVWATPCIVNENEVILKTIYPSRKYTKIYRKGFLP